MSSCNCCSLSSCLAAAQPSAVSSFFFVSVSGGNTLFAFAAFLALPLARFLAGMFTVLSAVEKKSRTVDEYQINYDIAAVGFQKRLGSSPLSYPSLLYTTLHTLLLRSSRLPKCASYALLHFIGVLYKEKAVED